MFLQLTHVLYPRQLKTFSLPNKLTHSHQDETTFLKSIIEEYYIKYLFTFHGIVFSVFAL
jgi:hypothetical protein